MNETSQTMRVTVHHHHEAAADPDRVIDAQGRAIDIRAPDILMQARFERLFGDDNANYRLIMGALSWVRAIDGAAVLQPSSVLAYEALLQRVGEEALSALVEHIARFQAEEPDKPDGAADRATLKNS